jgi:L-threonylcarbamoyladenylate synthase
LNTRYLTSKEEDLARASQILRGGGLVAFPTETVYGLGANALDGAAVEKIFRAKGRPADNPLIVHVWSEEQLTDLVTQVPKQAKRLMEAFWPGPLTIVMNKREAVPEVVSAGLSTVAVRMPSHPVARELLKVCNLPIAAPSANTSGKPSPTKASYVMEDMDGKIDAVIDGGSCQVGVESTVVDVTEEVPLLLRPGGVTYRQLTDVLGEVVLNFEYKDGVAPKSPGMKYKHYSPNAEVYVVRGDFAAAAAPFFQTDRKVGVLCRGGLSFPKGTIVRDMGSSPEQFARDLFAHLREFDHLGADVVLVQDVDSEGINLAVRNRLYKAAGYKIIGE